MELSDINADGSFNDGTPQPRPNTTPAEQEMSDMQRNFLVQSPQDDGPGWLSRQWDRLAFKNAKQLTRDNLFPCLHQTINNQILQRIDAPLAELV